MARSDREGARRTGTRAQRSSAARPASGAGAERGAGRGADQPRELVVERLVAGGDGLARDGGRVVFVPGTVPGDRVEARLVQVKRDFARAAVVRVIDAGPDRVEPACPEVARGCGGCDWQHVRAEAQLAAKVEVVRESLRRIGKLPDAEVVAGGRVEPWGYRTSMRAVASADGRLGLRRAASNDVIAIERCMVAHPALESLRASTSAPAGVEVSLRVSVATGDASIRFDVGDTEPTGRGAGSVVEHVDGVALRVGAGSFFQSGPDSARLLVATVRRLVADELAAARHVADVYGGVGLFAAALAHDAPDARFTVVEGAASSCADARHNLDLDRCDVVEAAVEQWRPPSDIDVLIADPSRAGLGAPAAEVVAATRVPVIVLVSCDPVALARDANLLHTLGYDHRTTVVLDLFPQTHHVEAVTRFDRRHIQETEFA
jgi:23S rRNA (uracil1939-C5)-methyltransferase